MGGLLTGLSGLVLGETFPSDDNANSINPKDDRDANFDFTPAYETDETIVTLEINHDFGNLALTSVTGYHEASLDARNDYDGTGFITGGRKQITGWLYESLKQNKPY